MGAVCPVYTCTHVWKARTQHGTCACVKETMFVCVCMCICVFDVLKLVFSIITLFCSKAYKLSKYQSATDQASDSPDGVYCTLALGSGAGNMTYTAPILRSDTMGHISVWQSGFRQCSSVVMFIQQFSGVFAKYLEVLLHLMLMISLWNRSFYSHFTDGKAEDWWDSLMCPLLQSEYMLAPG